MATLQWLEESFHVGGRGGNKKKPLVSDSNEKLRFFFSFSSLLLFLPCRYVFSALFISPPFFVRINQHKVQLLQLVCSALLCALIPIPLSFSSLVRRRRENLGQRPSIQPPRRSSPLFLFLFSFSFTSVYFFPLLFPKFG